MPEKSLEDIEQEISEAEDQIRKVRGEQQLKSLKKQKQKELRKKKRKAKLRQTKAGRTLSNLSDKLGSLFQQAERLDGDGQRDASDKLLQEAGTVQKITEKDGTVEDLSGEIEIEGTLEIDDAELQDQNRRTNRQAGTGGLPPAFGPAEDRDEDEDRDGRRDTGGLPDPGF